MLKIKTIIKESNIHGIGLFADEDIKEGDIIWEYNPLIDVILTEDEMCSLADSSEKQLRNYCYRLEDGRYILPGDDNRFINYSDDPNVLDVPDPFESSRAKRFIKKGEELTTDYCFDFDQNRDILLDRDKK